MKIQFCGGWGYAKYSDNVQREVERMSPGKFKFQPMKDSGVTGRLEVSIWAASNPSEIKIVHSKTKGQGYPESDWTGFHKRLDQAEAAIKVWAMTRLQIWAEY